MCIRDSFLYEECEFSEDEMLWYCVTGEMPPSIEEGNHTMELTVEDLEVGNNYTVAMYIDICENMAGCEYDYMTFDFTASASEMSETFYLETDNYTCDVNINVHLYADDYWGHVAYDNFRFRGPCEEPPSPFTLTYDGMDYEVEYHYNTYDDCTDSGWGWECEVSHDYDGDGEADEYHYEYFRYEDCEFSEDDMVWYCEEMVDPYLDAGNHTMEIMVEGLEPGMNYSLAIYTYMWLSLIHI